MYVVRQKVIKPGGISVSFLESIESFGSLGEDFTWSDIESAILFKSFDNLPEEFRKRKLKVRGGVIVHKQGDTTFEYSVVPVKIVPVE